MKEGRRPLATSNERVEAPAEEAAGDGADAGDGETNKLNFVCQ